MKRISLDVPDDWHRAIKQATLDDNCNSSAEFIRLLIAQSPEIRQAAIKAGIDELSPIERDWGGKRDKISKSASEASQVDVQDTSEMTTKPAMRSVVPTMPWQGKASPKPAGNGKRHSKAHTEE